MKTRALAGISWLALAVSLCAFAPAALPLGALRALRARPAAAAAALAPDKGKFRILLEGSEAGSESFEISQSTTGGWIARGDTTIHQRGQPESHASGQLRLSADGTPVHYEWTSQAPKKISGSVDFAANVAKTTIVVDGKAPFHQDFTFTTPRVAILDNNLYDQYAILAALYDWNARGKQSFPVLIPQDMTPGSIDLQALGQQSTPNGNLEALRASTPDLEIVLYLDARHRLIRLEVPAAKVAVVRE